MTRNIKKAILGTSLSLVILLACFALGLLPLNLFFLKTTISDALRKHTGAELTIEGPLRLKLGWNPRLTAHGIKISLPAVTQHPSAFISKASIRGPMLSALRGEIDLSRVTVQGIVVNSGSEAINAALPEKLNLNAAAPLDKTLNIQLEGQKNGGSLSLSLTGASLNALLSASQEYPFQAELKTTASSLHFAGDFLPPWNEPEVAGKFTVVSSDLAGLLRQFGQEIPALGPLSGQTGLQFNGASLLLEGMEGSLDGLTFLLSATARDWSSRPSFELKAHLPILDLAALPGVDQDASSDSTTDDLEFQSLFDQLSGFDGRAEVTIGQIQNAPVAMDKLAVSATLNNGHLAIEDAQGTISGAELVAQASLDVTQTCPQLETSVRFPSFDLETLAPFLEEDSYLAGQVMDGWIKTSSCGASVADHLHSLQTDVTAASVELIGRDDQPLLQFEHIEAEVNRQQPGRISFETQLFDEPAAIAVKFGSLDQIVADELWPVEFRTRANSYELEFSGQTAFHDTGLILNLSLDARLATTDLHGELAWSGPGSSLPLKVNLSSTLIDLQDLEILLPGNNQKEPEPGQDWSEFLDENTFLERWLEVPSFAVNLSVNHLHSTQFDISNMGLNAHLQDRKLEGGKMQLDYEGVELDGVLDADMSEPSWIFDYQVSLKSLDIGRVMKSLGLSENIDAHAERADFRFEAEGTTLRELVRSTRIESSLQSLQWSFTAGPENRRFDMNLSDLSLVAIPGSDTVWETNGDLNGSPIRAWLKTPNLRATFDRNLPLPARFIVGTGTDVTMIDVVVHPDSGNGFHSEIQVSGRYSDDEKIDLASLPAPLEDYALSTDLRISKNEYLASDIKARIGSSSATGSFRIQPSGEGFQFNLEAASPLIETDDLVRGIAEFREAGLILSEPELTASDSPEVTVGLFTMINQYADEFIGDNAWEVSANISELRSGGRLLGETEFGLQMDDRNFILDPATIRLPGGNVVTHYSGQQKGAGWDYDLEVYIERLEYGGLLRLLDPDSTGSGVVHVNTSLHSRSEDVAHAMKNLEGHIDIAAFPDDVQAGFLDLWASNLVFALLPTAENNKKRMNCMVARFEVENGVMKSKNTFLDSTEIIVRASGEIDLANRQLDLLAAPQAKTEKFLSVSTPIQVSGSFDDYSVSVSGGGFVMTMIRWYYGLIYVPWKWLTGERFPADGIATCFHAMDWELPTEAK
jgi:uncharacterized protein involved in outer membrane biogenesis